MNKGEIIDFVLSVSIVIMIVLLTFGIAKTVIKDTISTIQNEPIQCETHDLDSKMYQDNGKPSYIVKSCKKCNYYKVLAFDGNIVAKEIN